MNKLLQSYYSFHAFYRAKILKQKTPLIVFWNLTDQSNAQKPCYAMPPRQEKELSASEAIDVVDRLHKANVRQVILTGGDPMVRFDIGSIIDQLREKNISVLVETHGFFADRKVEILKVTDLVILPLDGPEEIHDRLRYPGSYQEVLRAAKVCDKNSVPFVFRCTLTSENVDLISVPLEIARHFNRRVYFEPIPPILPGTKTPHPLMFSSDRMKMAMVRLKKMKKSQYPNIGNSESSLTHLYHWPELRSRSCDAGWISAYIDLNGDCKPCRYVSARHTSNVLRDGFIEAFNKLTVTHCSDCWQFFPLELHEKMRLSFKNIPSLLFVPGPY
ncbi:MAG: radical SAM protein [Elusimicrobia bacterium]|nr:radical SAM protein [Elusimicrobiota bacterium]MBD3411732.1 radical SAM protein [Elusimicrobiota bacterium]